MSALRKLKRMENALYKRMAARGGAALEGLKRALKRIGGVGRQKLTVMVIPHDEKRMSHFQFNLFGLAGMAVAVAAALVVIGLAVFRFADEARTLDDRTSDLGVARANLDALREEANRLVDAAKDFRAALKKSLEGMGIRLPDGADAFAADGLDLDPDIRPGMSGASPRVRETAEIAKVGAYLERTIDPIKEFGLSVERQKEILAEVPNIWPIRNGLGHISMYFGQNENPFTGQWYTHTGIDISTFGRGDPLVATADGVVAAVTYDNGYGNNVIIRHKHGFYTRYAHMDSTRVRKGQQVKQGQVIGTLGNTGLTTGPHVHYEVHLGKSVLDPLKYLNVKSSEISLNPLGRD